MPSLLTHGKGLNMSRRHILRSLQTIEPSPELAEKYLLMMLGKQLFHHPEIFPKISSTELFGNDRPLELDIGCGTGEFTCGLALHHPDTNYVGIELHTRSLHRAIEIAARNQLDNIRFIRTDYKLIDPILPDASLQAVYLHYPDPNPRPKLQKRRIFNSEFLDQMHRALTPDGHLSIITDHPDYFIEMLQIAERDPRFQKTHRPRYLTHYDPPVKSRYQRIWEGHNLPTLRFELRKHTPSDPPSSLVAEGARG